MSLMNWFNKPKWKSKDTQIRLNAVKNEVSAELVADLPRISQNDESSEVRVAAVRRLKDYQLIATIIKNDSSPEVKQTAIKMLSDWIQKESHPDQLSILQDLEISSLFESAAKTSSDAEIRNFCIDKISKQGLLADLIIAENSVELRQKIAEKITKPATLKRVIKALKNKDKSLAKSLSQRLESKGDQDKILRQKATELCTQMEQLIHNSQNSSLQDIENIEKKWTELSKDHDLNSFQQRFDGALQTAKVTLDPQQREAFLNQQRQQRVQAKIKDLEKTLAHAQESEWKDLQKETSKFSGFDLSHADAKDREKYQNLFEQLTAIRDQKSKSFALPDELVKVVDDLEKSLKQKYNQPGQIKKFRGLWEKHYSSAPQSSALKTLKIRFDNSMSQLADSIEASASKRDEAAKQAVADIDKVSKLIKDGHLAEAKIAINKIAENKRIAAQHSLVQKNKFAFDTLWKELKELRKWQKWSNDEIRIRLIEDLKSLIGTGTHPDTLLKKMKDANKTWKDLEDSEKLEGDKFGVRNVELWGQFREVQKALFEPAQPYFEKRSELWNKELETVEEEIKNLQAVDLQSTEDRDLARMVRAAVKRLRSLDKIPPKKRGACASGLRSGIKRLDEHLAESYEIATRRKEKLIQTANELIELEDLDSTIEQAKSLQADWKKAGIVNQAQERKLWKSFRKANDAIFNRLKQKRDEEKQESNELLQTAKDLIQQTSEKINSESTSQAIHSLVENFKDQFNALKVHSKSLEKQAQDLIKTAEEKNLSLSLNERLGSLKILAKKAQICQDLELQKIDKDQAEAQWSESSNLQDSKLDKSISKRFKAAQKGSPNPQFNELATHILIAAEYLTGTATPEEDKELRLNYQVDILSKRMSGEETSSTSQQATELLTQWYSLTGSDQDFLQKNTSRIDNVIKQLYDLIES